MGAKGEENGKKNAKVKQMEAGNITIKRGAKGSVDQKRPCHG